MREDFARLVAEEPFLNRGGEEAVGPLLGQGAVVGEHDGDHGPADLALDDEVGDQGRADVVELEDGRVPLLDDGDDLVVHQDCVIADGERLPGGGGLLMGELPRVALASVDDDLELLEARGAGRGSTMLGRAALAMRADCQKIISRPRARVMTNWLRASRVRLATMSIAAPRRASARHGRQRHLVDDLGVLGPGCVVAVAVDLRDARPRLAGAQDDPRAEGDEDEIGQARGLVWVAGDEERLGRAPTLRGK